MAPKEAASQKAVFDYLVSTNRPYSVNDIVMNLHKEHGKAVVQRVLDQLVEQDKIKIKLNGKQSCYYVNQERFETCSEQELAGLDKTYSEIEEEAKLTGEKLKQTEARLRELTGSLTDGEARSQLEQLRSENKKLRERLQKLENNQQVISAADKAKMVKLHETSLGHWRKRKRMATEVLDSVLESWPKSKKCLYEEIGIETDESVGVSIPKK